MLIVPVILSGGTGSRLWPSSRSLYPKQFLTLVSNNSMLQETLLRLRGVSELADPVIVANEEHRFIVAEQLRECGFEEAKIILEPVGRNTAPAISLAALEVLKSGDEALLVLPADHVIEDIEAFEEAIYLAKKRCEQGDLVTFGIVPTHYETGFGYIRNGEAVSRGIYKVGSFVEKPDLANAKKYVDCGEYSWNSGMFMFKASTFLEELGKHQPVILERCESAIKKAKIDFDFIRIDEEEFFSCEPNSIDYAVMERTSKGVVIPLHAGWSDVGSWSALWEIKSKDEDGNVTEGDVILDQVRNCYLASDQKLVAAVGIDNIVLVESDDAILVANKDRVQNVKDIVNKLRDTDRTEAKLHRKVHRPWGYYDSLESGEGFQVKRLVVYPGAELSLQMHHHRAEHWVVVKGTAKVVNGDEEFLLRINESTYIPIGVKHRLANPGMVPLELIEVQSGSYLGEDDIVRFNDVYGRKEERS